MYFDDIQQAQQAMNLAIGRLFRLGSRSFQNGDIELYEEAKKICFDVVEYLSIALPLDMRPNYARDYSKLYHD